MKLHALAFAMSALSAATAMAQGVGDRYGYSRTDYDSQPGHYAYGRALTWSNKTNFNAPPPPYDAGDPRRGDQSRGRDGWTQNSQPSTQAPLAQAQPTRNFASQYAPAYGQPLPPPPTWRPPAQGNNREPLRPRVYSQSRSDQGQSTARSYDPAPPRPRIYGQINGDFYGRPLTPQAQAAQMQQAARVYGSASNPAPNAEQGVNGPTQSPQPSEAPIQGVRSYDPTPAQAKTYGQPGQTLSEQVPSRLQTSQVQSNPAPQAEPIRSAPRQGSQVADPRGAASSPPAPVRMAQTEPLGRGQVHLYSLHREYGLKPDAIPAPNPNQGLVLIGPSEAPAASSRPINQDDETAKEKAF